MMKAAILIKGDGGRVMCESNHSAKEDELRLARLKPDYQDT